MNSHYLLAIAVSEILQVVNPTMDDRKKRFQVINYLQSVVEAVDILRGATVEPFGSFVSNLFTRWGDLDISIELHNGAYIFNAAKKLKQKLLLEVSKALTRLGGFHRIRYISNERVPILKCERNKGNISCEISISNLSGQMKSKLLFWLTVIDSRFRDMVLIVKEWAKAHNINNSSTGTLNSYSLSLLVIFHFQTCEPAILPPLREIYPGNMADDLYGVRADAEKKIEDICGASINRIKINRGRNINKSSLADLFISFLAKFSDINMRASTQGISLHNGKWENLASNGRWQPKNYSLFIEDPFEQPANCAMSIGEQILKKIARAFQRSFQELTSGCQTHHPLAVLVRPEVLNIIRSRSHSANLSGVSRAPSRPQFQTYNIPNMPHLQAYNVPNQYRNRNDGSQNHRGRYRPQFQNYNIPNMLHLQAYNVPNQYRNRNDGPRNHRGRYRPHFLNYNIPNRPHLHAYNFPNQYQNRFYAPQNHRGRHAPVQVQQQAFNYQKKPNQRVNYHPLQRRHGQGHVEVVSNRDAPNRNPNSGESSKNLRAQLVWRVRSEGDE